MVKFWKLHGAGNDFIAIDGRLENMNSDYYSNFARKVCHRHFGIGADGLLVVKDSNIADVEMMYYNADGSLASMCGNGIRCFCKYIYDNKIVDSDKFTVSTLDGIKHIELNIEDNNIRNVKVNMGKPNFNPIDIPVSTLKDKFINEKIEILDKTFEISTILMGVPHTVIYVDELDKEEIFKYGPKIESHNIFPQKTNVNFVKIIDENNIIVYTWERGCGYTLACGTGITASVILSHYLEKTSNKVNVTSEGGKLTIEILDDVYMIGPAVKICEGKVEV
jgi:diaminopimelate epimerase